MPEDFEIVKKAVLQVTDIKTNRNKYYAIELHSGQHQGRVCFRVFTHYGRTDDLETNPEAGQKECRYFDTLGEAQAGYDQRISIECTWQDFAAEVGPALAVLREQWMHGSLP